MSESAIRCEGISKSFILEGKRARKRAQRDPSITLENGRVKIHAVKDVALDVKSGEIFGFLGRNGAGKTTTVKMLCTLVRPDSGSAWIKGWEVGKDDHEVRKRIGCVFGPLMNYHRLTGRDNLRFWGRLYHIDNLEERVEELSQTFGMENRIDHLVETYSTGMKCRLALMRGILHEPAVLFLDEPTLGLDPSAALRVRNLIKEMKDKGTTIFLCTHYLAEAEFLCDRIGIISKGELTAVGSPGELESAVRKSSILEIETDDAGIESIRSLGMSHEVEDGIVRIPLSSESDISSVLSAITSRGVEIKDIQISRSSLEEVFVHFTSGQG
jgi:ABC-2 type transport system ATP-binding protein